MTPNDQWTDLEKLARAATPGPWAEDINYSNDHDIVVSETMAFGEEDEDLTHATVASCYGCYDMPETMRHANAQFIAASNPQVILQLIALARSEAVLRDAFKEACSFIGGGVLTNYGPVKQPDGTIQHERYINYQGKLYERLKEALAESDRLRGEK